MLLRVAAELRERVAHRGEVDDGGNAGEVLQQDARGAEGDLLLGLRAHVPVGHRFDVGALHERAVLVPEQILEEDLQAEGKLVAVALRRLAQRIEPVDRVRLARDVERRAAAKRIE